VPDWKQGRGGRQQGDRSLAYLLGRIVQAGEQAPDGQYGGSLSRDLVERCKSLLRIRASEPIPCGGQAALAILHGPLPSAWNVGASQSEEESYLFLPLCPGTLVSGAVGKPHLPNQECFPCEADIDLLPQPISWKQDLADIAVSANDTIAPFCCCGIVEWLDQHQRWKELTSG